MCINEDKIKNLMGRVWNINPEEIPSDVKFNSFLYWDSIGHVNLLTEMESEFGITIDYRAVTEFTSIPSILTCLKTEDLK